MGLAPIGKSPLKRGLIFGSVIFALVLIRGGYQIGTVNGPVLISAIAGGIVGGGVYGLISWLRFR